MRLGGCIESRVAGDFRILLKYQVIESLIKKSLSKSSVIQYEICAKSLKLTYNLMLFS